MTAHAALQPVVIAEDDEDIARVLAETLRSSGTADPIVVSNGALVVDAVISSGARLLILDVQMPGASGIDVYDVVRSHPALRGIPVLFVTANPEIANETLRGNARREVIAKPFDIDLVAEKVRELLADAMAASPGEAGLCPAGQNGGQGTAIR